MVRCSGLKFVGQHGEQGRIVGAAAGNYEFSKLSAPWQHEAAYGIGDRTGGQGGGRGDYICLAGASTTFDETLGEFASEFFASCGLRRLAAEEGQAQKIGDNRYENCARRSDAAVAIVGLAEETVGDGVNHHVARAGVESRNLFSGCSRRDCCQICDATDVLHDASDLRVAIEQVVEEGNQRRAFASGGHVGGAEIGDDRDADTGGDHRAFSGLPGDGQFAAQEFRGLALVVESLAVASDQFCFQAEAALGGEYGFGVEFGQQEIQTRQIGYAGLLCVHGFQHGLADFFRVWVFGLGQEFECEVRWSRKHAGESPATTWSR